MKIKIQYIKTDEMKIKVFKSYFTVSNAYVKRVLNCHEEQTLIFVFFIRRCSPHLVSTMFFYGNKAHIQRFHHFLQLGPLPCDLKFLPIRGRGSPPHEYKLAHVTCFNQWDFNCCDKSRSPKCACMIELAVMSLSHCQEKNFPPMTTASSL